ncbi:MAG: hypothetical protein Q3997_07765 [Propionibacteriaceae bacterium]|nr:hypothetical protein [Propionibacteriaceae bacterium]
MSVPGWYPDPAEYPGHHRRHDAQPTAPRHISWLPAAAALLAASLAIWLLPACSTSHPPPDSPTSAPGEHRPSTTPPTTSPAIHCPNHSPSPPQDYPRDGWLHGGGLKVKEIPGWKHERFHMGWISDLSTQTDLVDSTATTRWISMIGIGALKTSDGFDDLEKAADRVLNCYATPKFFSEYDGHKELFSESVTVGGKNGWRLRSNVYVNLEKVLPGVKGDRVDIIVVDTGSSDYLGVLITSVKIGDVPRTRLVDQALDSVELSEHVRR